MAQPSTVQDFLSRLNRAAGETDLQDRTDRQVVRVAYEGQAVGRTDDHMHLAVETGVLAIPVGQIADVLPLSRRDPNMVRILVTNDDEVRYVKGGQPLKGEVDVDPDMAMSFASNQVMLRRGIIWIPIGDTYTITGGRPDACDDIIVIACW